MFCVQSGWVTDSTKTVAPWLITVLAIYFHSQKCRNPAAEYFGSKCRWLSWKLFFFLFFGTDKWDFRSPHLGCIGSSGSFGEAVRNFGWIWEGSAVKSCSMLYLLHAYRKYLLLFPTAKEKFHSQSLPQCLPSLKQNNTWLDLEVSCLTYVAVVFCLLIVLGYKLEAVPAAVATPLLTETKTVWFSHLLSLICWGCFSMCIYSA